MDFYNFQTSALIWSIFVLTYSSKNVEILATKQLKTNGNLYMNYGMLSGFNYFRYNSSIYSITVPSDANAISVEMW